jgi:hypothetical protein
VAIFNFRADRVVELSKAFEYKDFKQFDRKRYPDVSTALLCLQCYPDQPLRTMRLVPFRPAGLILSDHCTRRVSSSSAYLRQKAPVKKGPESSECSFLRSLTSSWHKSFATGLSDLQRHAAMCAQVRFAGMMQYDGELKLPKHFLVPPPAISRTTGEFLARSGVSTFACSESQKIGHVTFFWNGNRAAPFDSKLETFHEVCAWEPSTRLQPLLQSTCSLPSLHVISLLLADRMHVSHQSSSMCPACRRVQEAGWANF